MAHMQAQSAAKQAQRKRISSQNTVSTCTTNNNIKEWSEWVYTY
jgi:hypothetical protein